MKWLRRLKPYLTILESAATLWYAKKLFIGIYFYLKNNPWNWNTKNPTSLFSMTMKNKLSSPTPRNNKSSSSMMIRRSSLLQTMILPWTWRRMTLSWPSKSTKAGAVSFRTGLSWLILLILEDWMLLANSPLSSNRPRTEEKVTNLSTTEENQGIFNKFNLHLKEGMSELTSPLRKSTISLFPQNPKNKTYKLCNCQWTIKSKPLSRLHKHKSQD